MRRTAPSRPHEPTNYLTINIELIQIFFLIEIGLMIIFCYHSIVVCFSSSILLHK